MNAIDFVVRTRTGAMERGTVGGEGQGFLIDVGTGSDVSLNISQNDLRGYDRAADDLLITLADGRVIVVEGFFETGDGGNRLFLSADGILNEVSFVEADGGALFAQYGPTETWGKWSPSDELIFIDEPTVVADAAYADGEEEEVSMLAAGLLGVPGLLGAGGLGAAGLAGAALLAGGDGDGDDTGGGGDDDGGEDGDNWTPPTVDNADEAYALNGEDEREIRVTGTANPGSEVTVTIGDEEVTVIAGEDRGWEAVFDGDRFPEDGTYEDIDVVVTDPDGTVTELDGPTIVIDTTPPLIDATDGTVGSGDLFNAEQYEDGVSVSGTGEPGATVTLTIGDSTQTTTVDENGDWGFAIDETTLPEGEYVQDVVITATDDFGNSTTVNEQIQIDTVPNPITIDTVGGDNLINGAEADAGFQITGTSTPGASVTVTFAEITETVVVAEDGTWTLDVTSDDFPGGEYTAEIVATTVDSAGNPSSATSTLQIDTVSEVTLTNTPLTGDDVIGGDELEAGLVLTGTTQPGSSVEVTIEGVTQSATVAEDGTWTVTFGNGALPTGIYDTTATVTATDTAGNVATTSHGFAVDTETTLSIDTGSVAGDGIINLSESQTGVALTGSAEPGASVTVTVGDASFDTTAGADGAWTVALPSENIPTGETTMEVTAVATDALGNTATASGTILVDTVNTVSVETDAVAGDGIVNAAEAAAGVTLTGSTQPGSTVVVHVSGQDLPATVEADGSWSVVIAQDLITTTDGTLDVSVTSTDAAGNAATASGEVAIDLETMVAIADGQVEGDGVVNADERADDVPLTGVAEAGAAIVVTVANEIFETVADSSGAWSVTIPAALVPEGETSLPVSVTATDLAGNTASAEGAIAIDTETTVTLADDAVEGDGVVNADERADDVPLTGSAEAGAAIVVTVADQTFETVADGSGAWSVTLPAALIPEGETSLPVSVTATDLAGNTASAEGAIAIDTETTVTLVTDTVEGDGVINAAEQADGVTLSGAAEPGAAVTLSTGGQDFFTTADASGGWSVNVPAALVPTGVTVMDVSVTAVDAAGNSAMTAGSVAIDTETAVTLADDAVEGDGVVNADERADGVPLTGLAEAGAAVVVTVADQTFETTADSAGAWSVTIPVALVPAGETTLPVSVAATDMAGNSATASGDIAIDTETTVTLVTDTVEGDGVINAAEQADGVTLSGSAEPGAAVTLSTGGQDFVTTADASGGWSVNVPAALVPTGVTALGVTVTAVDAAGNSAMTAGSVAIDTETAVTLADDAVEGDGVVNAAERADGVFLTGQAEPGASVNVTVQGTVLAADMATDGSWSVTIPAALIPEGETSLPVSASSTDAAGNTATVNGSIRIDTETDVSVRTDGVEGDGIVNAAEHADGVVLTGNAEPGASVMVTMGGIAHAATVGADGSWTASFSAAEIPTGETTLPVTAVSTDAAGNTATATGSVQVDTLVRNFDITSDTGGADGIVNAEEAAQGITLTGTTEPGGSVVVTLDRATQNATVDANGNWTVTFSESQLPQGEQTVTLTAVSTDIAGNSETLTQSVTIDTDAGLLTIDPEPIETDDVVNFAEASDGVVITGTSNPGQMVTVTLGGVSHVVQTDANGTWSAAYTAAEITPGTYTAEITAEITDSAGNSLTRTDSVDIDTEVLNFGISGDPIAGDDIINATEAGRGVSLSGTTEAGGTVEVVIDGIAYTADVTPEGDWEVTLPATAFNANDEYGVTATLNTTDPAGNTASATVDLAVDTWVHRLNVANGDITPDNVVNALEAQAGITLAGQVEVGSTVEVMMGGVAHVATVNQNGYWTVDIPGSSIPRGTLDAPVTIEATDPAGNVRSVTETISIDTDLPEAADVESYTRDHTGLRGVSLETTDAEVQIGHVVSDTFVEDVGFASYEIPALGETSYAFNEVVPDGSHLVIAASDAAGNTSGTYLVVDDTRTSEVTMTDDLANTLSEFQVEKIDLQFAEDSAFTITEAQLVALSDHSDTLVVEGGADDSVTITGAQATGTTTQDGMTYNVFSLGDATLLIEENITNVVI